jgi:hypothetical protein
MYTTKKKSERPILEAIFRFFVPERSAYDIAVEQHSRSVSQLRDRVRAINRESDNLGKRATLDLELLALQKIERKLTPGSVAMNEVRIKMGIIRFRMKLL